LAFPYLDTDGSPMTYTRGDGSSHPFVRLKPDHPSDGRNGRKRKYESPLRASCRVYIPAKLRPHLNDPGVSLLITEGEKKTLCADQHGFPCIGLGGVWAWQKKRLQGEDGNKTGRRELIPHLAAINCPGRAPPPLLPLH